MISKLVVLHQPKLAGKLAPREIPPGWFIWETCLRQIAVGWGEKSDFLESSLNTATAQEATYYFGAEGYRFLLEIVTGLHSPIIGETEVLGQFRAAVDRFLTAPIDSPIAARLGRFVQRLYRDTKSVREAYLQGQGGQSYGSLSRKYARDMQCIQLIGAGQLAAELIPWLQQNNKSRSIEIYCRDKARAAYLEAKFPYVRIRGFDEYAVPSSGNTALIVAAPLTAAAIEAILGVHARALSTVLDFRANAAQDRISGVAKLVTLSDFFREIESTSQSLQNTVDSAKREIQRITHAHIERVEHRPFGWEDVCA